MKFRNTLSAVLVILLFVFHGCSKPEEDYEYPSGHKIKKMSEGLYARKLEDPYDIHNIIRAVESLRSAGVPVPDGSIEPNHSYMRFLPANDEELAFLENDSTLILFDYPLNYEFTGNESGINYAADDRSRYCVVAAGKKLPAVKYEIIYDVFIPPAINYTTRSTSDSISNFYEDLLYESARLTGNIPDEDTSVFTAKGILNPGWKPGGRIRVWDDLLDQYIPLEHVTVHARWFTHIETALTDGEGYFRMSPFRNKVNYSIKWENSLFTIRDGTFLQAWYNGPRKKGDWNLDIRGGKSMMFATIHRAANKHFYGENLGIFRPVLPFGARTRISYNDENGTGEFIIWNMTGITPNIQIWGRSGEKYRATNEVFASTAHELGHQSHHEYIGHARYKRTARIIRESWAEAVEWAMTNDEYNKLGRKYNNNKAAGFYHHYHKHSSWPLVSDRDYSPVFIDLADTVNQRILRGPQYPNDLITNYSLSFINNKILMNSSDINSLRSELAKNKMEGVDDFQINELLQLY